MKLQNALTVVLQMLTGIISFGSVPKPLDPCPLQARYGWPIGHENDLKLLNQMGCQVQRLWSACWARNT